jgi:WD40 repeat protein
MLLGKEVSTASGSDRVIVLANLTVARIETRSHPPPHAGCPRGDPGPLAVLTASLDPIAPFESVDSAIDLSYKTILVTGTPNTLHPTRLNRSGIVIISCALICLLIAACTSPTAPVGPKFRGRLLLLAGESTNGANLFELTAAPDGSTYNHSIVTSGVFEAAASPDRTRLLYTTKDGILLRDLRTGDVKPLVKGDNFCLAWSPDGRRFSYKQRSEKAPASGAGTKLYASDLDGKAKLIWEDFFENYGSGSPTGQSSVNERAGGSSGCAHWIGPDRLIFDRFLGAFPKQKTGGEPLKPNTTTLAILSDTVKLSDTERKWSIESICQVGSGALLRPHDQGQPILIARSLDHLETLNPAPAPCSGCRFIGFAAQSCVPFFIEEATATSSELFSLNPTNWQRQRGTHLSQTFSVAARGLINSSARLMIVGDAPASLILIDTESGEIIPFFPKSGLAPGEGGLLSPVPVVWIEQ